MRFIDEVQVRVASGKGGNGCSSFRREKYVPLGGPDGGDGGRGGDVVMVATTRRSTLLELRARPVWQAEKGSNGRTRQQTGACGQCLEMLVPVGTRVIDDAKGEVVGDLVDDGQRLVVARGGNPGLGNIRFKSSTNRAPREHTMGAPGEEFDLRLELLLMADVGLLGFPNAGKSTLVSRVSAARPKVADYPFTTLVPSLGVVDMGVDGNFVVADVPGLVRGAAGGAGLGHQFLKHLGRTRVLLHLVSLGHDEEVDPVERYLAIRDELARYDETLSLRPEFLVLTKGDVADEAVVAEARAALTAVSGHDDIAVISAVTGAGVRGLVDRLWLHLKDSAALEESAAEPTE